MENPLEKVLPNSVRESKGLKEWALDLLGLILSLRKVNSLARTPSKWVAQTKIFVMVKVFHTLTKIHLLNQVLRLIRMKSTAFSRPIKLPINSRLLTKIICSLWKLSLWPSLANPLQYLVQSKSSVVGQIKTDARWSGRRATFGKPRSPSILQNSISTTNMCSCKTATWSNGNKAMIGPLI